MEFRAILIGAVLGVAAALIHSKMMAKGGLKYT
jgi:hypothetical protein